ncbi:DUF11 domain-containing protein [Neomegalonema sp.]|uniref:DUF11 domain-containing protein n=1 Tax=Neomegalonema sp. TaxID=2039713 RepID=UPI00261FEAFD|nr:DUF11 domain-containing protein [Neomegalonema sp.]MDD2867771.1 DUF11 domain-containing protein [Neomegalonema sp.]
MLAPVRPQLPSRFGALRDRLAAGGFAGVILCGLLAASPASAQLRTVTNPDFEDPLLNGAVLPPGSPGSFVTLYDEIDVPGWSTTATDHKIEIWHKTNTQSTPSYAGSYFAELNANLIGALYQEICLLNDEPLRWRFAHRNRTGGANPQIAYYEIASPTNSNDIVQLLATQTTSAGAGWLVNENTTGAVRFAGATGLYRIQFRSGNSGSTGNFLDDVHIILSPFVEFAAAGGLLIEGGTPPAASLPALIVDGTVTAPMNVYARVTGGTAVLGVDYTTPSGTDLFSILVPPGVYAAQRFPLGLTILQDEVLEALETIQLEMQADPANVYAIANTRACGPGALQTTAISIQDDDVDLVLTKTADPPTALVGSEVVFTLSVRNAGHIPATNVRVTDLLPSGFEYLSDDGGGAYDPVSGLWTHGVLAAGATARLEITARIRPSGLHENIASVTTDSHDVDPANDVAAAMVDALPVADLALTKTVALATPNVGDLAHFTLNLTNLGPSTAESAVVTDLLPSGLLHVSDDGGGAYDPASGLWSLGDLARDGVASLTIVARVAASGSWLNEASAASNAHDPEPANNAASAEVFPFHRADVSLTKSISDPAPLMGFPIDFTLTLRNARDVAAHGLVVRDLLPSGYLFMSASSAEGTYDLVSGLWSLTSALPLGGEARLFLSVLPLATGSWTNVAEVIAMTDALGAPLEDVDSIPGNGDPDEDDQDQASAVPVRGTAPPVGAAVCPLGEIGVDWASTSWAAGASSGVLRFGELEGFFTVVDHLPPAVSQIGVGAVGPGGAAALALRGAGQSVVEISFSAPVEGLRMDLRGLGGDAGGLEYVGVMGVWAGATLLPRMSGGGSVSLSGGDAVGVLASSPTGEEGRVIVGFDGRVQNLQIGLTRFSDDPAAPWEMALNALTACRPQQDLTLLLSPDHEAEVPAGQLAIYAHRLQIGQGLGGGAASFEAASERGLTWALYRDDGDGVHGPGDALWDWSASTSIPAGDHLFWLVTKIPEEAPGGWSDLTRLTARVVRGGVSGSASVADLTRVGGDGSGAIFARKLQAVDADCNGVPDAGEAGFTAVELSIGSGHCVVYRIRFENRGVTPVRRVRIHDHTPSGTLFYPGAPGRVISHPPGLTPLPPVLPVVFMEPLEGEILFPFDGALAPGESGEVEFGVWIPSLPQPSVSSSGEPRPN